ncbi:hypothetical protein RJ641_001961, partial [Dillenia turbinata]
SGYSSSVIAVTESYVVLDIPAETSLKTLSDDFIALLTYLVVGSTDNIEESCATFATRALGLVEPLRTTHQIDNCTEVCVVLARTKEYCSVFHEKIRVKQTVSMILRPERVSDILLDKKDDIQIYLYTRLWSSKCTFCMIISIVGLAYSAAAKCSHHSACHCMHITYKHEKEKKVKKLYLYLALVAAPVPVGIISHYMRPVNLAPRLISEVLKALLAILFVLFSAYFIKRWHWCQLEVLECKKVPWPISLIKEKYCIEDSSWLNKEFAYECKISILTGKTYQVSKALCLAMSFHVLSSICIWSPVVGDSMYMPAAIAEIARPRINPFGKFRRRYSSKDDEENAVEEWIAQHGKEPSVAIGLQTCEISFDNWEHYYEAGSPW